MSEYIDLIQAHSHVMNTYELQREWDVWIEHKQIGPQKNRYKNS